MAESPLPKNIAKLRKYQKLYKSSESMGCARILRNYLQLDKNFPIPLSISHGVDMNHCRTAMDVTSVEPLHWSCHQSVHERAATVKPSVKLPHPWLILKAGRSVKPGAGVLVIGPPPGKSNDHALLACLENLKLDSFDLLLKHRGEVDASRQFWLGQGINVVSAGPADDFFYDRLFDLLENYEYVIGCTLSSALFFAASIGRKCKVIEDYVYSAYETGDYLKTADFTSLVAKKFTHLLSSESYADASTMAIDILGGNFLKEPHILREELFVAIEGLRSPVHFEKTTCAIERKIVLCISRWLGKSGLIRYGCFGYLSRATYTRASIIKINEIDIWLNGVNDVNCQINEIKYMKNVTEPGYAVDCT